MLVALYTRLDIENRQWTSHIKLKFYVLVPQNEAYRTQHRSSLVLCSIIVIYCTTAIYKCITICTVSLLSQILTNSSKHPPHHSTFVLHATILNSHETLNLTVSVTLPGRLRSQSKKAFRLSYHWMYTSIVPTSVISDWQWVTCQGQ